MDEIHKQLDKLSSTIVREFNKIYEETPGERHDRLVRERSDKEVGETHVREDSLYRTPGNLPMGPGLGLFQGDWKRKPAKSKKKRSKKHKKKTKNGKKKKTRKPKKG
jgi:hypothetical protein